MLDQVHRESIKNFAAKVKGVPFVDQGRDLSGWDCWGLILAAYKTCLGVALPSASDYSFQAPREAGRVLLRGAAEYPEVPLGAETPGDVIIFKPCHAALVLRRGWMLNCREQTGTVIERYDNALWQRLIVGIYRYEPIGPAAAI